jgi:hypothetical protein
MLEAKAAREFIVERLAITAKRPTLKEKKKSLV